MIDYQIFCFGTLFVPKNYSRFIQMRSLILIIPIMMIACHNRNKPSNDSLHLRNEQTEILYQNLKELSSEGKIMFGCANPTTLMYKKTSIKEGFNNSDCKEIIGQNPAYYESDFMWFDRDSLKKADIEAMKKAHNRGAVVGYCWHMRGKESGLFYSKNQSKFTQDKDLVKKIVAGGDRTENKELNWLYTQLDSIAIPTFKELGFPVTFRPWHEMNGSWFWWGSENCIPEEYIKLYRLTVDYIRSQGIFNILYVWSPDTRFTEEYYPGDEYVDIFGLDIYEMGAIHYKPMDMIIQELEKLTDFAEAHHKIAAITETGLRKEGDFFRYPEEIPDYWTNYVLAPIINNPKLSRLIWVESWYSADWSRQQKSQFYIPYRGIENNFKNGQAAIDDFIKFYNHPATVFEDDLPDMYVLHSKSDDGLKKQTPAIHSNHPK